MTEAQVNELADMITDVAISYANGHETDFRIAAKAAVAFVLEADRAALAALGHLLHTQNNRITAEPLFAVQKRNRVYGIDIDYDPKVSWVNGDSFEVDAEKAAELEAAYQEDGDDRPGDYKRLGYHEYWEFVTACFTEQGCKDYIARNGHNLGETRIYAYGTYRNEEWKFLRGVLMAASTTQTKSEPQ